MERMKPFSLLVKPASADCNLRCAYCFYLDRCHLHPESTVHRMSDACLQRMMESFLATEQEVYVWGWQGGEPTLMGLPFFEKAVALQKQARPGSRIANGLQTNGTLITPEFAAFLENYHFLIGVSLDGPAQLHDQYRLDAGGQPTHERVLRGIRHLQQAKAEFNILTLVSQSNVRHGGEVYRYLRDEGFMFHQYIPCVEQQAFGIGAVEWGKFLLEVFEEWCQGDQRKVSVRLFDSILSLMIDGSQTVCNMGGQCCQYFVVEYNGDVYPCDFFVEESRKIGNVMDDEWSALQASPIYQAFGACKHQWNDACGACDFLAYCSGDCLKHRYQDGIDPTQLSTLCAGWKLFFKEALPEFRRLATMLSNTGFVPFPERGHNRNLACFCGSGLKYKKCHGAII